MALMMVNVWSGYRSLIIIAIWAGYDVESPTPNDLNRFNTPVVMLSPNARKLVRRSFRNRTVTEKEQLCTKSASVAAHVTSVTPSGKVDPDWVRLFFVDGFFAYE